MKTESDRQILAGFGARLRIARDAAGLSQDQLSKASGAHRVAISRVESGHRELGLVSIVALAEALGVEVGVLVDGLGSDN